jgi:hypothetical protein
MNKKLIIDNMKATNSEENPKYHQTLFLPHNAKQKWTAIMQYDVTDTQNVPEAKNITLDEYIVKAEATFEDGVRVIGGVKKQKEYNYINFDVFSKEGVLLQWAIDVSDHEDFDVHGFVFAIGAEGEEIFYALLVKEKEAVKAKKSKK